ncbi:hypothetical protein [Altererythrobacter sp. GH1-8]|uniref:hypothetical protein n=1 Tax=Altererythrobacter sp. GH1-8 TaxID=3349333 RepID=UPI00374CD052
MHPFTVGDLVECIDDTPLPDRTPRPGEDWVCLGKIYRIRATLQTEREGYGVGLEGVSDNPPRIGWHAWRFRKLEPADDEFCEIIRSLNQPRTPIEEQVVAILEETEHHEGTVCTVVPGLGSQFRQSQYEKVHGPVPRWVLSLHPKRRTRLFDHALSGVDYLPAQCPRAVWRLAPDVEGVMRLRKGQLSDLWEQPKSHAWREVQ